MAAVCIKYIGSSQLGNHLIYFISYVLSVTKEANMDMKYDHEAKHKKRLNKMSNYVLPKSSHARKRHIPP